MKLATSFMLGLVLALAAQVLSADQGEKAPESWIKVDGIGHEILNMKKEIELTPQQARTILQKEFPCIKADWREQLPARIELAADARPLPLAQVDVHKAKDTTPFATLLRFSETQAVIVILKPEGSYLWHHYSDCLACLRVSRSSEIDAMFRIKELERTYGAVHKGLKQGSTVDSVVKVLGKPDAEHFTQAFGCFSYYYFKEDIGIAFLNFTVLEITKGVPEFAKERGTKGWGRFWLFGRR